MILTVYNIKYNKIKITNNFSLSIKKMLNDFNKHFILALKSNFFFARKLKISYDRLYYFLL